MIRRASKLALFILSICSFVACAEKSAPLPGDSVQSDGAVTLTPPRMNTAPQTLAAAATKDTAPLGAIESRVFPPELVMEHQDELGITQVQREAIVKEVQKAQAEMVRLQWELQGAKEKLVKVLDAEHVDERASTEAAARIMEHESKVKASHLGMLVRVKNLLTGPQQAKLRALRAASPG
jgi:Spy/CpxP family protein refolding chaperone